MRLSATALLLAGAGLAVQQVGAIPVRVIAVSSHQEVSTNFREPIAVVNGPTGVKWFMHHEEHIRPAVNGAPAHHCGGSLRDKAMRLSNKLIGYPKLEVPGMAHIMGHHEDHDNSGRVTPLPFIGTPVAPHPINAEAEELKAPPAEKVYSFGPGSQRPDVGPVRIVHMNEQEGGRFRFRHQRPFLRRLHFALMALGPWEGRAVAFVLGCGIGVLLRMVWVVGVVMARAITGRRTEESIEESAEAVFDMDAEEILVAPPQYTDEKAIYVVDDKATSQT